MNRKFKGSDSGTMEALRQDIRFGFRMLCKSPGFTAIALVTLAVGIGANTIMFSMVNTLLLRPMAVKEPDRLVRWEFENFNCFLYDCYVDLRDNNPVFSDLIAHNIRTYTQALTKDGTVMDVAPLYVTANYFNALGGAPLVGRTFLPEEEVGGAELMAVLSYRTWQRLGGGIRDRGPIYLPRR
jgi:putative ABC transport system permease protein